MKKSNYKAGLASHPEHSTTKGFALEDLATATSDYVSTLPLEDEDEESTEAFTTWFYAALGSPDLAALKAEHQPIQAEFVKNKSGTRKHP